MHIWKNHPTMPWKVCLVGAIIWPFHKTHVQMKSEGKWKEAVQH